MGVGVPHINYILQSTSSKWWDSAIYGCEKERILCLCLLCLGVVIVGLVFLLKICFIVKIMLFSFKIIFLYTTLRTSILMTYELPLIASILVNSLITFSFNRLEYSVRCDCPIHWSCIDRWMCLESAVPLCSCLLSSTTEETTLCLTWQ